MASKPRSTLWWASVAHFLNDGLAAALTPLLPLMAADLALSYSQAGAVKAALNGLTSLSQLPAGFLAARTSEGTFLGLGLGWFSLSYLLMGLAGGYVALLLLMASAGIGGGVYHPVGTAWVSRVFLARRRGAAVGTLNFAGDVGKVLLPALSGALIAWVGWRGSLAALGAAGAVASVALLLWDRLGRGATEPGRTTQASRATSWGIAVIWIFSARTAPMRAPTTTPARIISKVSTCRSKRVTTMAINMPRAPSLFPRTAVRGWVSPFNPKMKRADAIR